MQIPYTELHCVSNFSFLRGASHPGELVARALALEYGGLAITDECSFAGSVRAHLELKELRENDELARSFRLIHGTEIQLTEGAGRAAAPGAAAPARPPTASRPGTAAPAAAPVAGRPAPTAAPRPAPAARPAVSALDTILAIAAAVIGVLAVLTTLNNMFEWVWKS